MNNFYERNLQMYLWKKNNLSNNIKDEKKQ